MTFTMLYDKDNDLYMYKNFRIIREKVKYKVPHLCEYRQGLYLTRDPISPKIFFIYKLIFLFKKMSIVTMAEVLYIRYSTDVMKKKKKTMF